MIESAREAYGALGVAGYYEACGATYRNPHEDALLAALDDAVRAWAPDLSRVLDLACGSGEVTLGLRALGAGTVEGVDPYTGAAYQERTGRPAEPLRFEDIGAGALDGRSYSLVVCSYALHLAEASWLPATCLALARVAPALLVLTPHKRPELRPGWGWSAPAERVTARVRARYYRADAG